VLGINAAAEPIAKAMGVEGIVVETVKPGYGAEAAGLRSLEYDDRNRPIADVITAVAGQRVTKVDEIWEIMGEHKAGDVVPVDVLREGKTMHVDIKLQDSN
jgi:S1-C subfamily serine protease